MYVFKSLLFFYRFLPRNTGDVLYNKLLTINILVKNELTEYFFIKKLTNDERLIKLL